MAVKNEKHLINRDELPQVLRDFASYKSVIEGCSNLTVEEYLLDLRTYFRFIIASQNGISVQSEEFNKVNISDIDIEFVKSIKTEEIYEFLMYAGQTRGNGWSAKSRKLSALKAFYKYFVKKRGYMDSNPTANIDAPKRRQSLVKHLSLEECILLLDAIKNDKASKTIKRDFAIVTLFLNCGMRLSELVMINLADIDREFRSVRVTGKGSKQRIVYLNDACRAALSDYIEERMSDENKSKEKSGALFLSGRNTRISNKTVQWVVYKYLKIAGLENKGYSVHKLRHTAATLMYQTGNVDVRVLKDILGHEQLNTTQIYTHVSDANMENAINQNPLSKIKTPKK